MCDIGSTFKKKEKRRGYKKILTKTNESHQKAKKSVYQNGIEMASTEGTDSIELESVFSSKNIHSSTLKSSSGTEDGKHFKIYTDLQYMY